MEMNKAQIAQKSEELWTSMMENTDISDPESALIKLFSIRDNIYLIFQEESSTHRPEDIKSSEIMFKFSELLVEIEDMIHFIELHKIKLIDI